MTSSASLEAAPAADPAAPAGRRPLGNDWRHVKGRGWLIRRALLAADIVGLALAFLISEVVAPSTNRVGTYDGAVEAALLLAAIPAWAVAAKLAGLYHRDEERADYSTADDFFGVLQLLTLGTWLAYAGVSQFDIGDPQLSKFFFFWLSAVVLVTGGRAIARGICRRRPSYIQRTIIVGGGDVGQIVARKILQHPEYGIRVAGFVDSGPKPMAPILEHIPLLGDPEDVRAIVNELGIERVIVAFSGASHESTLTVIRELRDYPVQIDVVPRLFELIPATADLHSLESVSLISLPPPRLSPSSLMLKRTMDAMLALSALVFMSPLLLLVALSIKLDSPGPAVFRQRRMGKGDRPFTMLKFRTMAADAEELKSALAHLNKHNGNGGDQRMFKIPDDPRTTRIGRVLRRYSLDEIPQLWNVLRGEMSLVGPRPLIPSEDQQVDDWGRTRLNLKPGVTGLWQVLGRDAIPFEEMVRLDYLYVTTWSLWNDIRIMVRTFGAMGRGERPPHGV